MDLACYHVLGGLFNRCDRKNHATLSPRLGSTPEGAEYQIADSITMATAAAVNESRGDLLSWINELLQLNVTKVESIGTGAVLCQIMDSIYGMIDG